MLRPKVVSLIFEQYFYPVYAHWETTKTVTDNI